MVAMCKGLAATRVTLTVKARVAPSTFRSNIACLCNQCVRQNRGRGVVVSTALVCPQGGSGFADV